MRAKRAKQYRKLMKAYEVSFNFREPYQVLLDAQTICSAHDFKMHLGKMLENTLSGTVKPMITQCCIRHLYAIKPTNPSEQQQKDSAIEVAKAAERRRCGHHELDEPLSTLECLKSVVDPKSSGTNKNRYVVASQVDAVREEIREIAGVPLIYIRRSVMILEPMASKTAEAREREEKGKVRAGLKSGRGAEARSKRKLDDTDPPVVPEEASESRERKKKKTRGPKEPNPLSIMKSKKATSQPKKVADSESRTAKDLPTDGEVIEGVVDEQRKRKRKRKPKEDADVVLSIVPDAQVSV